VAPSASSTSALVAEITIECINSREWSLIWEAIENFDELNFLHIVEIFGNIKAKVKRIEREVEVLLLRKSLFSEIKCEYKKTFKL